MARVIAINLLLIFLPLIIYSAFILLYKQPEDKNEFWRLIPLKTLFTIGFLAMGIFYLTQVNYNKTIKDGVYHPATIKDGKVIPGYISPPETKPVENTELKPDTQSGQNTPAPKQADPAENTQAKTQPNSQPKPQSNPEATPEKDNKPDTDQKKQQDLDEKQI